MSNFAFEHGAVDTHAHVFSPFVPFPEGAVQPPVAVRHTKEEYYGVLRGHGMTHGLMVQPSHYREDNGVMLESMAGAPSRNLKGIAVIAPGTSDAELDALAAAGVVGTRWNVINSGEDIFTHPAAKRLLERLRERGWWLQLHVRAADFPKFEDAIRAYGRNVIFDHMGRPGIAAGTSEPGFLRLLAYAREAGAAVKLSGAAHVSKQAFPWADADPFARAVIDAFGPDDCVWGSDYPFVTGFREHNYTQTLAWLLRIVPDIADRKKVLWDNPARMFGFTGDAKGPS